MCAILTNKFQTLDKEELESQIVQEVAKGLEELSRFPQVFIKFDVMLGEVKFSYYMYMGVSH